jgi:hypothetical protein
MTLTLKDTTGNYALDQLYDNKFPSGSALELRSGAPAGPNNAAGGSLGISYTTSGWAAAASKSKAKSGSLTGAASGTVTLGHYRLKNAGDTEREEGTITVTGGGGDLTVDNTSVNSGQTVTVNTFTKTIT